MRPGRLERALAGAMDAAGYPVGLGGSHGQATTIRGTMKTRKPPALPPLLWHYTAWEHLAAICESGALKRTNVGAEGEAPMLWFSSQQQWEPTATKLVVDSARRVQRLTFQQQVELFGCVRFGLASDDSRILDWKAACALAGTPGKLKRKMEAYGQSVGANPAHWFATAVDVPLPGARFQVWLGQWHDADATEMAVVWKNRRKLQDDIPAP